MTDTPDAPSGATLEPHTPAPPPQGPPIAVAAWEPVRGRANWSVRFLVLSILLDLVAIWSGWLEIDLLERAATIGISTSEANANDNRQGLIGLLQLALLAVNAVLFIRWLRRITANLPALHGGRPRYGTGWATGGWFVPILNFWRPYQVVAQAWRRSDPEQGTDVTVLDHRSTSPLLGLWWAAWIITGFLGQASGRLSLRGEEIEELQLASQVTFASDIGSTLTAFLAILVIRELTGRHEEAARRRGLLGGHAGAPESGA